MEYSNLLVVLMGVGTVFFGLICLILLVWVMGLILRSSERPAPLAPSAPAPAPAANSAELIAAISAAIAEETGEDISAIRITSIHKL